MTLHERDSAQWYTCPLFDAVGAEKYRLCHGYSTRFGGNSTLPYLASMNFGFQLGEERGVTLSNYRTFSSLLGIPYEHLTAAQQTHTGLCMKVGRGDRMLGLRLPIEAPEPYRDGWDAFACAETGVALSIRVADCVPILFWDPVHHVIGAAHAGWRGTYDRVAPNTVSAMEELGAKRQDILVSIGISVGRCCYEVDEAFHERFLSRYGSGFCEKIFDAAGEKYFCDLRLANELLLSDAGILPSHIDRETLCTCCDPVRFHSHRAAQKRGGKRGLMAAMISMEE